MFFELHKTLSLEGSNMGKNWKSVWEKSKSCQNWIRAMISNPSWAVEARNKGLSKPENVPGWRVLRPYYSIATGPLYHILSIWIAWAIYYQWWRWRRKTKGRVSPNLLLHNWVVEGRCVSCSTTDLEALVNQTRLLCSGVPDGASALLWCTRWVPRAGPAYLRPPLALHSIRRQTPQCTNAQIDKYFDRYYSNIKHKFKCLPWNYCQESVLELGR